MGAHSVRAAMRNLRAAVVQMRTGSDRDDNLRQAADRIRAAAAEGADLVALPEVIAWRGPQRDEVSHAEAIDGPTLAALATAARENAVWLVGGSFLELDPEGAGCWNTCPLLAPDGTLVARYRKIHLFDIDLPGRVSTRESDTRRAGNEVVTAVTPLGRIGLAVCYDLRFPELFRRLADEGTEIVVMPSAFTLPTGRAHWHALVRARAIENQCFFLAPNQFGRGVQSFSEYGHSLIVDPWGEILAEAAEDAAATIAAELDAARLASVRRDLPALQHRKLRL